MVWRISATLVAVLLVTLPLAAGRAVADEIPDRPRSGTVTMRDLDPTQRSRARVLYQLIMCDCPKESYTRTLANCPDACADPQKRIINRMVLENRSDEEVKQTMLQRVGQDQRVLASPETFFGRFAGVFAFMVLGGGAIFAFEILRRWHLRGQSARQEREQSAELLNREEVERVDRELAQLD